MSPIHHFNHIIFMKLTIFFLSLVLGAEAEAIRSPAKGDEYFKEATAKLFDNDLTEAQVLFAKARRKYKQEGNYRKMNDCAMAMAIIEFSRGDFKKSLKILNAVKRNHLKWCKDDPEGLKTIDESIALAHIEQKRMASTSNEVNNLK